MLQLQHGFGATIATLLPEKRGNRFPTMMPHHGAGGKADLVSGVQHSPKDVDIVSRLTELRIKSTDVQQNISAKRHIAARNMFRKMIVQHDVTWVSGAKGNALRCPTVGSRGDVRAAGGFHTRIFERVDEMQQPVAIGNAIRVGICNDVSARSFGAKVARYAESLIRLASILDIRELFGDIRSAIRRTVVNEYDLVVRIIKGR